MRILVADDDPDLRALLRAVLEAGGHAVETVPDGGEALARLGGAAPPDVAILDWQMPEPDGFELCRRQRQRSDAAYVYLIIVTANSSREAYFEGMKAGADDFLGKPIDEAALLARVNAAERVLALQRSLRERVAALEQAVARIDRLEGLLPICMYCKQIRDEGQSWQPLDEYIQSVGAAKFTHGLCEPCRDEHFPDHSD